MPGFPARVLGNRSLFLELGGRGKILHAHRIFMSMVQKGAEGAA